NSSTGWGLYSAGSGPNYFNGYVGIGINNPWAPLTVHEDLNVGSGMQSVAAFYRNNGNGRGVILGYEGNGSTDVAGYIATTGFSSDLALGSTDALSNAVEAIRIKNSTGYVGIATTNPANPLDVNGAVAIGSYVGSAGLSNGLVVSGAVGLGTSSQQSGYELTTVGG